MTITVNKPIQIFSVRKNGHYEEYAYVFSRLIRGEIIRSTWAQLKQSFSPNPVLFIDGDTFHLLFFPLILLRSGLGYRNYMLSIRTECVLDVAWQKTVKYPLYRILRKWTDTRIISTHKDARRFEYDRFVSDFIHDIQYWDLSYIDTRPSIVPEIRKIKGKRILSVIGELNDKKSRVELLHFLRNHRGLNFTIVFAGIVHEEDFEFLNTHPDCLVLNRYITQPEMFYVYAVSMWIWAFYEKDIERPSGIFGRAMQLGKTVIVRKGGFLSRTNRHNPYMIEIEELDEIRNLKAVSRSNRSWKNEKDSSRELRELFRN